MTFLERGIQRNCFRWRILIAAAAALAGAFSAIWLPDIKIDPYSVFDPAAIDSLDPEGRAIRDAFPPFDILTLSVANKTGATDAETLRFVDDLTHTLASLPEVSDVQSVTTTTITTSANGILEQRPLIERPFSSASIDALRGALTSDPMLSRFLAAPGLSAWNIIVVPAPGNDFVNAAESVQRAVGNDDRVTYGGYPYYLERFVSYVTGDSRRLAAAIALTTFVLELVLLRSFSRALIVWLTAGGAAALLLGVFAAAGIIFGLEKLLIVALVIIVSTSYGIHVVRFQDAEKTTPCDAAARVSTIVVVAATTTMLGFATLLSSAIPQLASAAIFAFGGIAIAMGYALFPGAAALAIVHPHPAAILSRRGERPVSNGWSRRRRIVTGVVVTAAATTAALGIFRINITPAGPQDLFRRGTEAFRAISDVEALYGATSDLLLYIDSGEEYGLLNPDLFAEFERFTGTATALPETVGVVGYTDVVSWFWDNYGTPEELRRTPEAIGEALELLSGRNDVLGMATFVDPSYRYARMILRINDFEISRDISTVADALASDLTSSGRRFNQAFSVHPAGISYEWTAQLFEIIRGLSRGVLLFFPVLFLLLVFVFQQTKKALVLSIPSVVGVLVYLGIFGWIQIPFTTVSAIGLAIVMGVSVDDAVYIGLFREQNRTTPLYPAIRAVIETTVVIVGGLTTLYLSRVGPVAPMIFAASAGLISATATVVLAVPNLLHMSER